MQNRKKKEEAPPTTDLKWVRHSNFSLGRISHIGRDLYIFGHGSAITFYSLADGSETHYRVARPQADGISCLAGHPHLPLFAFAELSNRARIFVLHWPDFRPLCTLQSAGDSARRILSMCFADTEYLAVLTGFSQFQLELWNWRTQRLLCSAATGLFSDLQYLKWSRAQPLSVQQIAVSLGRVIVWEVHLGAETAYMIRRDVPVPGEAEMQGPFNCTMLADNTMYVTNKTHCIWQVNAVTKKCTMVVDRLAHAKAEAAVERRVEREHSRSRCHSQSTKAELFADSGSMILQSIVDQLSDKRNFVFGYRGGLAIIDMNGQAQFYRKSVAAAAAGNGQQQEWTLDMEVAAVEPVIGCTVVNRESLIAYTESGLMCTLHDEVDEAGVIRRTWKTLRDYDRQFVQLIHVNPLGEHIVSVNQSGRIALLRTQTGELLASLDRLATGHVKCLQPFPSVPAIAMGNTTGVLHIYSVLNERFERMTSFHLSNYEIVQLLVGNIGQNIVARDESNALFIIRGNLGTKMVITNHIELRCNIIDMTAYFHDSMLTIAALTVPLVAPSKTYTDQMVQIRIDGNNSSQLRDGILPKDYISLDWTWPAQEADNYADLIKRFIAVPYLSNYFDICELNEVEIAGDDEGSEVADENAISESECRVYDSSTGCETCLQMCVLLSQQTMHRVCFVQLTVFRNWLLTWAQDGLVQVFEKDEWQPIAQLWALNHNAVGIRCAITDPFRQYFVTLGYEHNLQCLQHSNNAVDNSKLFVLRQYMLSRAVRNQFTQKTAGFAPLSGKKAISWVTHRMHDQQRLEREEFAAARSEILAELGELKEKLCVLIDNNEVAPDDEQLPIEAFDLDREGRRARLRLAEKARSADQQAILAECTQLERLTAAIVARTWDRMAVQGRQLRGIFTRLTVENYAMLLPDRDTEVALQRARIWRAIEHLFAAEDAFQPWQPHSAEMLVRIANRHPGEILIKLADSDESLGAQSAGSEEGGGGGDGRPAGAIVKHRFSMTGTSSHNYIAPIDCRYQQLEVVSYYQMVVENVLGQHDTLALRRFFNTKFEAMAVVKASELHLTGQRNDRLRTIQSELNALELLKNSGVLHERVICDPEYEPDEQPDRIVQVEAHELAVTPYISPSEQDLLDEAAAEAERRRLAMLADDFRERALMRMMNGVLEIRWEDEIKKVPPEPECVLSGKNPKDYTPEDLGAIFEYEALVKYLIGERDRYHGMLEEERDRIGKILFDQIKKFNLRIGETLMEKIKVEFAIASEDLKLLRNQLFNWERLRFAEQEKQLDAEMTEMRQIICELSATLAELEDTLAASRNKYEELTNKDRLLDRHFKNGYAEFASKALTDQAYRIFRRRPKWTMRAWQTSSILNDMARRISTADTSDKEIPLPEECFQYLQQIDAVDKVSNAPNVLDAVQWKALCRMRRIKLEMEFRVRAVGAQVADTESAVNAFLREINARKAKLARLEQKKVELIEERDDHLINRTVQLCMRRGIVEIALTGHLSDFDNAILLHSSDVHDINAIIKKAGNKKLKTMQNAAIFRRKITFKEWEHRVLRLKIEEKRVAIRCIQRTKITKEVQKWLKFKQLGWSEDISETALSRELEANRGSLEAMCNEIIKKINELHSQTDSKRRSNARLDRQIRQVNLDVAELQLARDIEKENREVEQREQRFTNLMRRSRLVREIQANHSRILELSAELELQRLRTFPTLTKASPRKYVD